MHTTTEPPTTVLAYTQAEAARRIGVSERTIRRLVANGELQARHIGRRVVILDDELRRFLAATPVAS